MAGVKLYTLEELKKEGKLVSKGMAGQWMLYPNGYPENGSTAKDIVKSGDEHYCDAMELHAAKYF